MNILKKFSGLLLIGCMCLACNESKKKSEKMNENSYGKDIAFLKEHVQVVELKKNGAALALVPAYQGRVMTSSSKGDKGFSYGWINYDLIASGKKVPQFNPVGGEERFWLGPEGGQYALYFEKDKPFTFENWNVPAAIDTEPFNIVEKKNDYVKFHKEMHLKNYSDFAFDIDVVREVRLLNSNDIQNALGINDIPESFVAYETVNKIQNIGDQAWKEDTGLPSIWLLCMMKPSEELTVVAPIKEGSEEELGTRVNDNYFGEVPPTHLQADMSKVFFKADGKKRSKIGITPKRATSLIGSYDNINDVLTILQIKQPEAGAKYVNSAWELQEKPYSGDAFNSYNDGPLDDGSQMGPFYELESSSPALALDKGESYTHLQRIYHFEGKPAELSKIAQKLLGCKLEEITNKFKK